MEEEVDVEEDRGTRTVGGHSLDDRKTWSKISSIEEYQGWRADAVTALISLAVKCNLTAPEALMVRRQTAATDNTATSSIEILRMDLV